MGGPPPILFLTLGILCFGAGVAYILATSVDDIVIDGTPGSGSGNDTTVQYSGLTIRTRDEWGARDRRGSGSTHSPYSIVIHHTYGPTLASFAGDESIRSVQDYHMDSNGWADIGYHYLVDGDGLAYAGRPPTQIGAHAGSGQNTGRVGVCLIGNLDTEQPTNNQIASVTRLVANLCTQFGITPGDTTIVTHGSIRATDCPGNNMESRMAQLRLDAQALIDDPNADLFDPETDAPQSADGTPSRTVPLGSYLAGAVLFLSVFAAVLLFVNNERNAARRRVDDVMKASILDEDYSSQTSNKTRSKKSSSAVSAVSGKRGPKTSKISRNGSKTSKGSKGSKTSKSSKVSKHSKTSKRSKASKGSRHSSGGSKRRSTGASRHSRNGRTSTNSRSSSKGPRPRKRIDRSPEKLKGLPPMPPPREEPESAVFEQVTNMTRVEDAYASATSTGSNRSTGSARSKGSVRSRGSNRSKGSSGSQA